MKVDGFSTMYTKFYFHLVLMNITFLAMENIFRIEKRDLMNLKVLYTLDGWNKIVINCKQYFFIAKH